MMPTRPDVTPVMGQGRERAWRLAAWGVLAALVLYRLWLVWWHTPPLDLEETYYLYWSLHPDLGYYSKPPMIAWLLAGADALLGHSAAAIKSVSLLLHTAAALLIYLIGRRLWSPLMGVLGAVVFYSLPIIGGLSLFTSTDAGLHFFWALALWAFIRARDTDTLWAWVIVGLAAGLGLLSKYTMGVMAIGLLGYLLSSARYRHLLRRPGLWLGVAVAALVWAPNLWWNAQHDFISFRHTAEISQLDQAWLRPDELAAFLLPQWPLFGLLLAPLLLWRLRHCLDEGSRLLLWVSLPMLGVISLQALFGGAHINWGSAAYVGLALLAGACIWQWRPRWLVAAVILNLALLSVAYHYHDLARLAGVPLSAASDPYHKRLGWAALGQALTPLLRDAPGTVLVSEDRKLLAYLGYFSGDWPPRLARWNPDGRVVSQYDLERNDLSLGDAPVIFVSRGAIPDAVLARFRVVERLPQLRVTVYPDLVRELHVARLRGFKGYAE